MLSMRGTKEMISSLSGLRNARLTPRGSLYVALFFLLSIYVHEYVQPPKRLDCVYVHSPCLVFSFYHFFPFQLLFGQVITIDLVDYYKMMYQVCYGRWWNDVEIGVFC